METRWKQCQWALLGMMVVLAAPPARALVADPVETLRRNDAGFGHSIDIDGDTAVVGAAYAGAAYVFIRAGDGWRQQAKLTAPGGPRGYFGFAVAVQGDTAVVADAGGSAHVFTRSGAGWNLETTVIPSDMAEDERYGLSAAIDDGTIVIGISGAAYVYTRNAGSWSEQARLMAPAEDAGVAFGTSVDLDGDTVVIGAPGFLPPPAAYVFTRTGATWSQQAKLAAAGSGSFGSAVAVDGDTALIGGYHAAHVFIRSGERWSEQSKLVPSDAEAFGFLYGGSVDLQADVALIGTPRIDLRSYSGAAYLFRYDRGAWKQEAKLIAGDGGEFGTGVSLFGHTAMIGRPGRPAVSVYQLGADPRLHCPGDIDGDGVTDLVVVTSQRDVIVKGLDGSLVNRFTLDAPGVRVDTELMPDTNGNGAPELVALTRGPADAEVRDLLTGGVLGHVSFAPGLRPVDVEVMPDRTGNGIPELASLAENPARVEIQDGLSGEAITTVAFRDYVYPMDLEILPDIDGDGAPELAVLGDNRRQDGADKIEIRDLAGTPVRDIWLGRGWRVLEQARIADRHGNGSDEVAVLRVHSDGRVNVMFRDLETRAWLGSAGFDQEYPPRRLLRVGDMNGNGSDEVAVFGVRLDMDGNNQKAKIRDSLTGRLAGAGEVFFDRNWTGRDVVVCPDVNGNGAEELAMLGRRHVDGALKVIVKDAKTGERLAAMRL